MKLVHESLMHWLSALSTCCQKPTVKRGTPRSVSRLLPFALVFFINTVMAGEKTVHYSDPITPILEIVDHARMNPSEDIRPFIVGKVDAAIEHIKQTNPTHCQGKDRLLGWLADTKKAFSTWEENGERKCYITASEAQELLQQIKPKLEALQIGLGDRLKTVNLTGESHHDINAINDALEGGKASNSALIEEIFVAQTMMGQLGAYGISAGYIGLYDKQFPTLTMSPDLQKAVDAAKTIIPRTDKTEAQHPAKIPVVDTTGNHARKLAEAGKE